MQVYLSIFDIICTKPCREYLSESDVRFMYNEMMTRSEQIYFAYVSYTMFLFLYHSWIFTTVVAITEDMLHTGSSDDNIIKCYDCKNVLVFVTTRFPTYVGFTTVHWNKKLTLLQLLIACNLFT